MTQAYPHTPGYQSHSQTSKAAAYALTSKDSMEADILRYLEGYPSGFTADELREAFEGKHPDVQAGTIAARLRGLELKNLIRKTKETRPTRNNRQAHVWKHPRHATFHEVIPPRNSHNISVRTSYEIHLTNERDKYKRAIEAAIEQMQRTGYGREHKPVIDFLIGTLK
jgi:hypothetical protein